MTIEKIRLLKETLKALSEMERVSYPMTLRETIKALAELEDYKESYKKSFRGNFYEKFYFALKEIAEYDTPLRNLIESVQADVLKERIK